MSSTRNLRKSVLCMAMGLCLSSIAAGPVLAQSATGSVTGQAAAGARVTITNPDTGFTRTVTADADGSYRIPFVPVGTYNVQAAGSAPVRTKVSLGNAATVNLGGTTELAAVQVLGSVVTSIDVSSTESATNITAEELQRLPVDRNVTSVALLAPGVNANHSIGGISFGGSSVAENSIYVNGLNVTDMYQRFGFSEAPFDFYREFQVKTGGYSVEFGRTTGGVINAVAKSGTNEFHYGAKLDYKPAWMQSAGKDRFDDGHRYITASRDESSYATLGLYASGPIVKDRLFFYALYQGRDYTQQNTNNAGNTLNDGKADNAFWGATLDWNLTDRNVLSLMAFSDDNSYASDVHPYDFDSDTSSPATNTVFTDGGGDNAALSWTSYITDSFSAKLMYGVSNRKTNNYSLADVECSRVSVSDSVLELYDPGVQAGCNSSTKMETIENQRTQWRGDFEWSLGNHLLRFGVDHEKNETDYNRRYPGPDAATFYVRYATPGTIIENGGVVPPGYDAYVYQRRYTIAGNFATVDTAYYIEDSWSITPNFILSLGLRNDSFDNRNGEGDSYIKIDRQLAPRIGFSWDMHGDSSMKLFGNVGRYYLPVANVVNAKQTGGLLDERTYYAFEGWTTGEFGGSSYADPILGAQLGPVDTSQGDGTVGDLRSDVDRDMDPVYQDEFILGFQQALGGNWTWGVRGIYRKLHNAIDDMEIGATAQCGEDYMGYIMANPGKVATVWGDSDCDGNADAWIDIDTSKEGWALYTQDANGDETYVGQRGWEEPKRNYRALEFQLDRAWDDKWSLNLSYTLAWARGNYGGPINSDTGYMDTGMTENFDSPWVNYKGYGPLADDHRHQIKARSTYAFDDHWQIAATLDAQSGVPITGFGAVDPFDTRNYYSYYICVEKCGVQGYDGAGDPIYWPTEDSVYRFSPRGGEGRTPWTYDVGMSLTYLARLGSADLKVKFAVYNVFNQQRTVDVDQYLQTDATTDLSPTFKRPIGFQAPRYGQLTVSLDF
jgi:hypothetical protein